MAEPKKTFKKTKRSSRPSAAPKSEDEVIEGAAIEKPSAAKSATPLNESTKPQNKSSTSKNRDRSTMLASQNVVVVVATITFLVALIALAVSVVTYQQTARDNTFSQPAPPVAMSNVDQINLNKLGKRLDNLTTSIAQNSDHIASLQQELASAVSISRTDESTMTKLDDLTTKLAALELVVADQMAIRAVNDERDVQGEFDTTQVGLLAAAGLLAENLAGRDLEIWAELLDDLQWPGVETTDRDIIRGAASTPVNSRAELLNLGRLQLAPMIQGINKVDNSSGLLEQARARLANLIKLRRTGRGDQPETMLESFELALDNADFDAAFAAATIWSSSGFDGLESWLMAAQRRHDLDQAVNRLVAKFVQHAAGKS